MKTSKTVAAEKTWTKPELVALGKIADVAGSPSGVNEGPNHS
ncbi:MAG: hypothetical protein ACKOOL_12135 [Novosphingobium sp.]